MLSVRDTMAVTQKLYSIGITDTARWIDSHTALNPRYRNAGET